SEIIFCPYAFAAYVTLGLDESLLGGAWTKINLYLVSIRSVSSPYVVAQQSTINPYSLLHIASLPMSLREIDVEKIYTHAAFAPPPHVNDVAVLKTRILQNSEYKQTTRLYKVANSQFSVKIIQRGATLPEGICL
ncbi:hypothetical protein TSAR_012121, partial [Trichomalopsis sarcophagae]